MPRRYHQICPVARTLDLIGERWTFLILRELFLGARTFTDIREGCPGISTRILSDRLKLLADQHLVRREVYAQHPLRADYRLTPAGESLAPVLQSLFRWGMEHTLDARQRAVVARHVRGRIERGQANPAARALIEEYGEHATGRRAVKTRQRPG